MEYHSNNAAIYALYAVAAAMAKAFESHLISTNSSATADEEQNTLQITIEHLSKTARTADEQSAVDAILAVAQQYGALEKDGATDLNETYTLFVYTPSILRLDHEGIKKWLRRLSNEDLREVAEGNLDSYSFFGDGTRNGHAYTTLHHDAPENIIRELNESVWTLISENELDDALTLWGNRPRGDPWDKQLAENLTIVISETAETAALEILRERSNNFLEN